MARLTGLVERLAAAGGTGCLARAFRARGDDISVLSTPDQFHQQLLQGIAKAESRITLAALYMGNSPLERKLLTALHTAVKARPSLQVNILIDRSRGLRGPKCSSVDTIRPLVQQLPQNVRLFLYQMPQLAGMWLPSPLNETVGVSHLKCFVFDNDLLMTGANLSYDYFTTRQDRYMQVRNHPGLAEFYHGLTETMGQASWTLDLATGALKLPGMTGKQLRPKLDAHIGGTQRETDAAVDAVGGSTGEWDTAIVPTLQFAELGIGQDHRVSAAVLAEDAPCSMCTAYLNLPEQYSGLIVDKGKRSHRFQLLTASTHSHGFANATGAKALIPVLYDNVARQFMERVWKHGAKGVNYLEYERAGWTFHAKGIWLWPSEPQTREEGPLLTVVGSSNYSARSVHRDLESQLVVVTRNKDLRGALKKEWADLTAHASAGIPARWSEQEVLKQEQGPLQRLERRLFTGATLVYPALKSFL